MENSNNLILALKSLKTNTFFLIFGGGVGGLNFQAFWKIPLATVRGPMQNLLQGM